MTEQITRERVRVSEVILGNERPLGDLSALKRSMAELGLLCPINITQDKRLIAGYHRLEAARQLGWEFIDCQISTYDALHAELAKLDENLVRNEGTELERATWLAREKEIYEILHPETKQAVGAELAKKRWNKENASDKMSFASEVAQKTGKDKRTIERSVKIGKELEPFKDKLASTPIADNQKELLALARTPHEEREQLVTILAERKANHLWEAKKIARENGLKAFALPEHVTLFLGDFQVEGKKIPDNSIDLIFTDPPYGKDYLWIWRELGKFAERVLKPGCFLITYSGQEYLDVAFARLHDFLDYYWTCAVFHSENQPQIISRKVTNRWKPILLFSKGPAKPSTGFVDFLTGEKGEKENDVWAQGLSEASYFIERFSEPGATVLDPLMGSGTTLKAALELKREAIGVEIDPDRFEVAKRFVSSFYDQG
jgi:ParB-like chromosome segregation protein Spo0J